MSWTQEEPFRTRTPDASCAAIAATQHGVISQSQAKGWGMTANSIHHRVRTGEWIRVLPRVYRLRGAPETWHQNLMAAALWAGESAVVSGRSAAALHEFDGFQPGPVEVSSTKKLKSPDPSLVVHRIKKFGSADLATHLGIPVTSPARTIVDVAGVVDTETLRYALDSCVRRRLFTLTRLRWQIRQSGGQRGITTLRQMIDGATIPHSLFERKFLRLIDSSSLEMPECQFRIYDGRQFLGQVDFCYPAARLIIETDGRKWHVDDDAFQKSRDRRNAQTSRGWRILHVTWSDLTHRPQKLVEDLRRALCSDSGR